MSPGGTPASSRTTSSFDSTGYTHILIGVKWEGGNTTVTPSDNKSSTSWTSHTKEIVAGTSSDLCGQFFSAAIGSPGTGHTATASFAASRTFITVAVWIIDADSGTITLVSEATNEGSGTTVDAGTLSNAGSDSVVSFMMGLEYEATSWTPGSGWTEDFDLGGGDNYSGGFSRGAETTSSIDPACTKSGGGTWGAISICFKEGGGGGGGASGRDLMLLGVGT